MRALDFIPDREALAQAIGLERRRRVSDPTSVLMIFAAGALVGGALALLFSPGAGERLRTLGERVGGVRGRRGSQMPRDDEAPVLREM